jgi:hypothetical protein
MGHYTLTPRVMRACSVYAEAARRALARLERERGWRPASAEVHALRRELQRRFGR